MGQWIADHGSDHEMHELQQEGVIRCKVCGSRIMDHQIRCTGFKKRKSEDKGSVDHGLWIRPWDARVATRGSPQMKGLWSVDHDHGLHGLQEELVSKQRVSGSGVILFM